MPEVHPGRHSTMHGRSSIFSCASSYLIELDIYDSFIGGIGGLDDERRRGVKAAASSLI